MNVGVSADGCLECAGVWIKAVWRYLCGKYNAVAYNTAIHALAYEPMRK